MRDEQELGADHGLIDPEDRAFVAEIEDPAYRQVVVSTLLRYRTAERLQVGDPVPDVALTRIEPPGSVAIPDLVRSRPVLLVFGSYT